ncbi:uncharacterized protein LOC128093083 [Culex pipiens pallens]|uniref:uncharacterized protein LOC128093083 n=1 Tax=Culex pipiens pallens TaxID=42434 RepID=UPI0022AA7499|nr:uncharacterized protein LOC128093083 [Culex pipiens pallens]
MHDAGSVGIKSLVDDRLTWSDGWISNPIADTGNGYVTWPIVSENLLTCTADVCVRNVIHSTQSEYGVTERLLTRVAVYPHQWPMANGSIPNACTGDSGAARTRHWMHDAGSVGIKSLVDDRLSWTDGWISNPIADTGHGDVA